MIVKLENCCSHNYLQMFMNLIPPVDTWDREGNGLGSVENYDKINLVKLNIMEPGNVKYERLFGIAMGLLIQIYDNGGYGHFIPEVHYCGLSVKDKNRRINMHNDPWPANKIKIVGILNHDWTYEDGGGFIYEDKQWNMKSTDFIIFDSRNQHSNAIVFSDKKRIAIDYLVSKRIISEND